MYISTRKKNDLYKQTIADSKYEKQQQQQLENIISKHADNLECLFDCDCTHPKCECPFVCCPQPRSTARLLARPILSAQ